MSFTDLPSKKQSLSTFDGRTDGRTDERTNERTNGLTNGQSETKTLWYRLNLKTSKIEYLAKADCA